MEAEHSIELLAIAREEIDMLKLNLTYRRYSHDEIEAACGGEMADAVRRKVMRRRAKIIKEMQHH